MLPRAGNALELFFKLFNNIKSDHEAQVFARLELESLVSSVEPVGSVLDLVVSPPFSKFLGASFASENGPVRVVDALSYELPYGKVQGYRARVSADTDLGRLARRLGYTREIYTAADGDLQPVLARTFPKAAAGLVFQVAKVEGASLGRIVTHQYLFEKSEYISKLSRDENEVRANLGALLSYPSQQLYRVPATATMKVGRRLEDWFAIREEPSLYLTHYMYPYKGKFHPKMARALINYAWPHDEGTVLDNFSGSGTTLVEAVTMGLDAKGVEINPLSVLMANAKCDCLSALDPGAIRKHFEDSFRRITETVNAYTQAEKGQTMLSATSPAYDWRSLKSEVEVLRPKLADYLKDGRGTVEKAVISRRVFSDVADPSAREFLLLVLGGTISDVARRTSGDFLVALVERFHDLYLRIFLIDLFKKTLRFPIGHAEAMCGDTRDMRELLGRDGRAGKLATSSVHAIVNSPPYSTALDYIENDYPQLVLLNLQPPLEVLREKMMGAPKGLYDQQAVLSEIADEKSQFRDLPDYPREVVKKLLAGDRKDAALRSYKFFLDMKDSLQEMLRVLKPGSKAAIVIGNNRYKLGDESQLECENDRAILEMGVKLGFEKDTWLAGRDLEKSSVGAIRYESIVVLKKPT